MKKTTRQRGNIVIGLIIGLVLGMLWGWGDMFDSVAKLES